MQTSFATLRLGCRGAMGAAVGIWLLVAGLDLAGSEQIKVTGRVLDAAGQPVAEWPWRSFGMLPKDA